MNVQKPEWPPIVFGPPIWQTLPVAVVVGRTPAEGLGDTGRLRDYNGMSFAPGECIRCARFR